MNQYPPHQTTINKSNRPGASGANKVLLRFTMVLVGFCSLYVLFLPQHGLLQLILLDKRTNELASELTDLRSQNEELRREIIKIKTDKQYLEEVARKKYGLLKENEILYEVTP